MGLSFVQDYKTCSMAQGEIKKKHNTCCESTQYIYSTDSCLYGNTNAHGKL